MLLFFVSNDELHIMTRIIGQPQIDGWTVKEVADFETEGYKYEDEYSGMCEMKTTQDVTELEEVDEDLLRKILECPTSKRCYIWSWGSPQ